MSGDKGGSKADTLVKVVLFFFISLLSFSVGTFVGKQVSDSDHRRMALEGEYSGKAVAANEEHGAAAEEGQEKITEKEVDALTEEFVNREKSGGAREPASAHGTQETAENAEHNDAHAAPAAEKAEKSADGYKSYPRAGKAAAKEAAHGAKEAAHGAAAEVKEAAHATANAASHGAEATKKAVTKAAKDTGHGTAEIAEKVAEGKAPSDGAKEEKKAPAGLPSVASSAVGKYTVQVGSFPEEAEAKTRAADLKAKGWNAFYLPATVKGRTWYRVLVGLFNNQDSAKQFRAQFMKEANTQSAIVQKIVQ